ncbi:MAG TPA: hypothetical protein VF718_13105, partial [Allosphingosinicella sp.]
VMTDLFKLRLGRVALAASAIGLGLVLAGTQASAQTTPVYLFEYSAKVICGDLAAQADILAGGRYFTLVNIHNPGLTASLRRKVAATAAGSPGHISGFERSQLRNDEAMHIDCPLIHKQADTDWVEGFLVIQSTLELDVVSVYTVADKGIARTFHTERVPARRIK